MDNTEHETKGKSLIVSINGEVVTADIRLNYPTDMSELQALNACVKKLSEINDIQITQTNV